jgi:DNA modification methylase
MAKLTEQEQQEIVRFLEAGKPLPDKYRFLLFDDKREVELVWNGKTAEVTNVVLPFQTIEQIDEPRMEAGGAGRGGKGGDDQGLLFSLDERGRQLKGWTNKLIWGDNKLILSSLKNGPLRDEIEKQGGLKLIYIDPPFDVGADFSMDIEVGDGGDTFTKRPNILEEIAYRDTWGKGADSFISMIYERLILMRDLLAEDGSIYVHCDWRVNSYIRLALDEVFGTDRHLNQIAWKRIFSHSGGKKFGIVDDTILLYTKSAGFIFNVLTKPHSESYVKSHYGAKDENGKQYRLVTLSAKGPGPARTFGERGSISPPKGRHWAWTQERIDAGLASGKIVFASTGQPNIKQYLDDTEGTVIQTIWDDLPGVNPISSELLGYPTQKSEALLERIVKASSNPGDLVADFFVGSGTTAAVAEKLGRKWIATDLGKFAIHTTRKRMIGVQRQLKADGKDYRAFELLNLGRYERQHYVGVNPNLREAEQQKQLVEKEAAFLTLILRAYRAEPVENTPTFHGKKAGRMVVVGPVNLPVTRRFVEEVILEARKRNITRVDVLGFEFEMGLFPNVLEEARAKGIDIAPKYIPADVFDKRAVEKNQVVFHDVSFIEVNAHVKDGSIAVELTDFSVFYSQDSIKNAEETLKNKASKIVVDKGQIVKVVKDKDGVVTREQLTKKWSDWIDYWSVDFNFESKREIIRKPIQLEDQARLPGTEPPQKTLDEWEEVWTGDYVFENEWQSFRTKKNRELEYMSPYHECQPGRRKVAVKVVDIFGNDTMTIVEVSVGGKKPSAKSAKGVKQ